MNSPATVKPDEITTFLGPIPAEEFERRDKLRSYRNTASALVAKTESDTARYLGWEVIEWASVNLYAPAPLEWLDQLNLLAKRLLLTAMQAEQMHDMLKGAANAD
jgi:hypothetical protein